MFSKKVQSERQQFSLTYKITIVIIIRNNLSKQKNKLTCLQKGQKISKKEKGLRN